jgi:hypothetical protein
MVGSSGRGTTGGRNTGPDTAASQQRTQLAGSSEFQLWIPAGTALALALLWMLDLFVLRTPVLTSFATRGVVFEALTPLYSFWMPAVRPGAVWFLLAFGACILAGRHAVDTAKVSSAHFAIGLLAFSCLLPVTLFMIREPLTALGENLVIYPAEEVLYDAQRITDLGGFVRDYSRLQPQLSMRGQHYPPGGAILLYMVLRLAGQGLARIAAVVLLLAATGVTLCYAAGKQLLPEVRARQAALLLLASPSLLNFACTSMDAVFFFFAGLCFLAVLALGKRQEDTAVIDRKCAVHALLCGALLYVACFFSFAAIPLGMCLGLYLLLNGRKTPGRSVALAGLVGAGFGLIHLGVHLLWGYSLAGNLLYAREHNLEFMSQVLQRPASSFFLHASFGNLAAFLIGSGVALIGGAAVAARRRPTQWTPWMMASVLSLLIMSAGGMFLMETERIWLFALPWVAAFAVSQRELPNGFLRLLMACGLLQAALMQVLLFTLW